MTYPESVLFAYEYDTASRLTALRDQSGTALVSPTYDNRGLLRALQRPSGTHSGAYTYDPVGRLGSIGIAGGSSAAEVTWTFTRNPASQILTETQTNDAYSWDGHVNLARTYTTNGLNQYEAAGSAAFCYDANGNLTADGASVYKYDVENRLVERRVQGTGNSNCAALSYAGTLQAELRYDPLGRLYYLRDYVGPNGITRFAYDGDAMIAEYNNATTLLRRYVHGSNAEADDPLVWYEGNSVASSNARHLHADPRGSIVLVAGSAGQTLAINTYDEYGIPDSASGNDIATKGRFRYTGQAWLPELDMYYYKARVYSPTLGRFLQTDPIGYEDQFNLYAYVGNDPVNLTDPTGMAAMGGCGSRIKGVNNCSGSSYFAYEGALQAHRVEAANAAPDGSSGSQGSPGRGQQETSGQSDSEEQSFNDRILSNITDGETAMTRQMGHDDRAVLSGEMSPEEYKERAQARAVGVAVGAAAHVAVRAAPVVARGVARGANKNPVLRIGPGWKGSQTAGHRVFRIVIGRNKPYTIFGRTFKIHKHLDLWSW